MLRSLEDETREDASGGERNDGGYVHRPGTVAAGESSESKPAGFGRAGWVLVAAVVLSFLVIPGVIYLVPTAPAELGMSFFATMLVLPMVPALLLGLVAVWSMTAATRGRR
ncbi:hypothetical protein [Halegenticoccus tardaugens]|uniref:hypothetical protein n=1 Tax=Halegenticoccus tardaugens TaxID=2071624 RepID=UPI00100BD5A3|nr:hypothetical protein [Halegenticoccus tardaugens]